MTSAREAIADRRVDRLSGEYLPRNAVLTARSILLFAQFRLIGDQLFCSRRSLFPAGCLTGHPKDVPNWIKISVQRSKSGT
jgi:hypothetical protein